MKNYIGNNNEINKKKYKHSLPPKLNSNAGNVEYNISMFNKMNDVNMPSNVAADVSGMSEDYKTRERIISELRSLGKNYKFEKYSDAQLYAMLNRILNQSRVKPQRKDTIDIKRDKRFSNGIVNDDPSYNFDDPDRIGDYKVKESIKESLNKIDHYCIDNDLPFYDLRSLYEATQPMTPDKKRQLKKLLDDPNVTADTVKGFIQGADPNRKIEELNESDDNLTYDELIELAHKYYKQGGMDIIEFWDENSLKEYEKEFGPMTKDTAIRLMRVMGNVTEDEREAGRYFSKQTYEDLNFNSPFPTWNDAYDLFQEVVDKYFPDEDKIDMEIENLRLKYEGNKEFDHAYEVWQTSGIDDDYDDEYQDSDDLIIADWEDTTDVDFDESLNEDTVKQGNKWVNKGNEGTHGKFNTKKEADAQRRAIWVNWNKYKAESLNEHILSENDLREAAKEYYDQVKKDIELINKYPDILTDKYNSKESLINGLENDVIEPFELYDWIIATLNEHNILIDESLDDEEYYTKQISRNLGPSVLAFMNASKVNNVEVQDAVSEFFDDYRKIPSKGMESLDTKYDCDKDRFYQKYRPFVDKCKKIVSELNPTGYGKTDYFDIKVKELLKKVDYNFPYGWKVFNGCSDRQNVNEDYTRSDDEWGDPYTYEEVYDNLKSLTNDFSDKDGNVRCWYEQEKIYGVDILKKYYKVVETSDARMTDGEDMSWVISYSGLKK